MPHPQPSSPFTSPTDLYERLIDRIDTRGWPLGPEQLHPLWDTLQEVAAHQSTPRDLLTLDIYLGGDWNTTHEMVLWVMESCSVVTFNDDVSRSVPRRTYRPPSVSVRSLDILNRSPNPAWVKGKKAAGLELMSALALHPHYVQSILSGGLPGCYFPGLVYSRPESVEGVSGTIQMNSIPHCTRDSSDAQRLMLYAQSVWEGEGTSNDYATPVSELVGPAESRPSRGGIFRRRR